RGRGVGGEGVCGAGPVQGAVKAPSPPTPLPPVHGRGEQAALFPETRGRRPELPVAPPAQPAILAPTSHALPPPPPEPPPPRDPPLPPLGIFPLCALSRRRPRPPVSFRGSSFGDGVPP